MYDVRSKKYDIRAIKLCLSNVIWFFKIFNIFHVCIDVHFGDLRVSNDH